MSKISLFNTQGAPSGELELAAELLQLEKGEQAVKDVVVATMNARRAGTGSTLGKGEVAGSGKKPWRQKGTGRARAGYRQSPVWRGGGIAMGPKPRDFSVKVNRKVARLAFRRALSEQIETGKISVIEGFEVEEGRTKLMAALLKQLEMSGRVLIVTSDLDEAVERAARNIPGVGVVTARNADVYSLLAARHILATQAAWDKLVERLKPEVEA